jgi:molybdenum cofactor cytidylyltransferase
MSAAVLAAGSARRMGGEKVLLALGGEPLVRRIVREVAALDVSEILVVANEQNEAVVCDALSDLSVHVLVNRRATEGMGTSIALAAGSVAPGSRAFLLLQGDQPFVDREMLRRLIAEWGSGAPSFVAASYEGVVTTPVLFGQQILAELRELEGDRGAKAILYRHRHDGREIAFPNWRGLDVDTPEDYRRACELWGSVPHS